MSSTPEPSPIKNLTTPLIKQIDKHQNKLLIPKQTHYLSSNNNFEIYLSGVSTKCGLMIGKGKVISQNEKEEKEEENKDYFQESTWPYFLKFTKENIPITLQKEEYIKLVSCGLQHLIIVTNFSKCYLFGDFIYGNNNYTGYGISENDYHFAQLLPFQMNDNTLQNQLNCKITDLDCGEQFAILKDELNRFWYCGKYGFGNGSNAMQFHFTQLNKGELKEINVIKKVVAGGRHVAVNVNDKFIYCIGNNYYNQLGTNRSNPNTEVLSTFSFVKADWNLDEKFNIQDLACAGNSTIVLTKCGKIFKTFQSNSILTEVPCNERILTIGTDWSNALFLSETGNIWSVGDYNEALGGSDNMKNYLFRTNNNYKEMKLFNGTGQTCFGVFNGREAIISDHSNTEKLISEFPVVNIKISGEITLVFCLKEGKLNNFQSKLFNVRGLFDIDFLF
ncbi:hypothetical protein ABK040_014054 [Willaertia magna]